MTEPSKEKSGPFTADTKAAVVRYQVTNVDRALAFYTRELGFSTVKHFGAALAIIDRGHLHLILSGPEASGSRPMVGGRPQEPGGWNRIVLYVDNIESTVASLKAAGVRFRN